MADALFAPEAFDAASGQREEHSALSTIFSADYLFGGEQAIATAGSVAQPTDQRAHAEAPDEWYAASPANVIPASPMTDPNGRWFPWDGSKPLTISLPDRKDIRSLWFPTSLGIISIYSGLTEGGTPLYTSNALAECAPIPSGNKTLTLVAANGTFGSPMAVYATNDVLAPSRLASPPVISATSGLQPIPVNVETLPSSGLVRASFVASSTISVSGDLLVLMAILPPTATDVEIAVAVLDIAGTPSGYSYVTVKLGNLTSSPATLSSGSSVPPAWSAAGNTVANALLPPVVQFQTATSSGLFQKYFLSRNLTAGTSLGGGTSTFGNGYFLPQMTAYLIEVQTATSDSVRVSSMISYSS